MTKWTYEFNLKTDIWRQGLFDTKEEAIEEAKSELKYYDYSDGTIRIGECKEVLNYGIDVDSVLEDISESVYSEVGEAAEDYLRYVNKNEKEELNDKLNEVFFEWQEKYGHKPEYYTIENEEFINIKE